MFKYILKRIGLLFITLVIIITVVFFLLQLVKGYPSAIEAKLEAASNNPAAIKGILLSYSQESNSFVAFWSYISDIFNGDFGLYYQDTSKTIPEIFFKPMKYTLLIVGPAFILGTTLGVIFGFVSGYKRGKWPDIAVNIFATFFVAIPSFVLATFLVLFGNEIGLPIDFQDAQRAGKTTLAVILPILIVTITSFSTLTYYIRNEVVTVLTSDFIVIAKAKGLSGKQVFFKHVIKNVSLPFIAIVLPSFITIIFGSMIIEMFFNVPGTSSVFATAVKQKEKNIIMFSTIFFTAINLIIQLLVDVLYVVFDRRISLGKTTRFSIVTRIKARRNRKIKVNINSGREVKNG